MLTIVNAKINLGLRVLRKRADGYHDLETVFYPVGVHNGTPACPYPFCDVLEITASDKMSSIDVISSEPVTEHPHLNIVWRAYESFLSACTAKGYTPPAVNITLAKHLPIQAGLGGGSADATFALLLLNRLADNPLTNNELHHIATQIGADCPFFLLNAPALAQGIGEKLHPLTARLKGKWAVIAKPRQAISTAEAFAHISPHGQEGEMEQIYLGPIEQWKELMHNDFEQSFATLHPECIHIKDALYANGAFYAAMSGSGSAFFGLFHDHATARCAMMHLPHHLAPYSTICLL